MHALRRLREARGLFQKDVASAIGVDRTTYVKYERGDSEQVFRFLKNWRIFLMFLSTIF